MPHPASWLLIWVAFVLSVQGLPWPLLALLTVVVGVPVFWRSPQHSLLLLRRSRWIFLSIGILFVFFTPGEYLPGLAGTLGMSREGLVVAAEQVLRLCLILLGLAGLHAYLGNAGIINGLYALMRRFVWRDRTVVRLLLVLARIEREGTAKNPFPGREGWYGWMMGNTLSSSDFPAECRVEVISFRLIDHLVWGCIGLLLIVQWLATGWIA